MQMLRSFFSHLQTRLGRWSLAAVLGWSFQPLLRAWAQPLSDTKRIFDGIQASPNTGANVPAGISVNPFQDIYNQIAGSTTGANGFEGFMQFLQMLLQAGIALITLVAVVFVIVAGVQMVIHSNSEDEAKKQITVIFNIIVGIVIMNVANFAVQWVAPNTSVETNGGVLDRFSCIDPLGGATSQTSQLLGTFDCVESIRQSTIGITTLVVFPLIDFALSFLAGLALLFIVYAALQIILHRGEEDKIKEARSRVFKVVLGFVVILLNKSFVNIFYGSVSTDPTGIAQNDLQPDLQAGIDLAFSIANYILGFLGLLSVVMLIYAGVLIVSSGGEGQRRETGLKILRYVLFGVIMAMSAYTLTAAIIGATIQGA